MRVSDMMQKLATITATYGDLEIVGGDISDDMALRTVVVVDRNGVALIDGGDEGAIEGVFITAADR